jgi:hypothetical protein
LKGREERHGVMMKSGFSKSILNQLLLQFCRNQVSIFAGSKMGCLKERWDRLEHLGLRKKWPLFDACSVFCYNSIQACLVRPIFWNFRSRNINFNVKSSNFEMLATNAKFIPKMSGANCS